MVAEINWLPCLADFETGRLLLGAPLSAWKPDTIKEQVLLKDRVGHCKLQASRILPPAVSLSLTHTHAFGTICSGFHRCSTLKIAGFLGTQGPTPRLSYPRTAKGCFHCPFSTACQPPDWDGIHVLKMKVHVEELPQWSTVYTYREMKLLNSVKSLFFLMAVFAILPKFFYERLGSCSKTPQRIFKRKCNPEDILPLAARGVTPETSGWEQKPVGDRRSSLGYSAIVFNQQYWQGEDSSNTQRGSSFSLSPLSPACILGIKTTAVILNKWFIYNSHPRL